MSEEVNTVVVDSRRVLFNDFLENAKDETSDTKTTVSILRGLVLKYKLPQENEIEIQNIKECKGSSTLRAKVRKILFGMTKLNSTHYINLVEKGPGNVSKFNI